MFSYLPLPGSGSIRLLRLIAHPDENTRIKCQLFDYPLQTLGDGPHLYEALSYVWGDQDNPEYISVNRHDFAVTRNLHAALLCLRDHVLDRFIWVDAICINQKNLLEKGRQIQYMAEIYSRASRVIVWLGPVENKSDLAIEAIRLAAENISTKSVAEGQTKQAIQFLVRRSWFRRIWVLQEVGAARNILIKCGRKEIGGYSFCAALSSRSFDRLYDDLPDVRTLIRSVTHLIRGAVFRPKSLPKSSNIFSLRIRPLGELIEMYHTREASRSHDKIFALLGMSSDDSISAQLLPDYNLPWEELLERLVKFLVWEQISVKTWANAEIAVINSQARILGQVSSEELSDRSDLQKVHFTSKDGSEYLGPEQLWTLQASAKSVQVGDLICLLYGAKKPMIIRPCRDHFAIIMIAFTHPGIEGGNIGYFELPMASFQSELLLIWDWKELPANLEAQYYSTMVGKRVAEHQDAGFGSHLDNITRLWNVALVLEDVGEYKRSESRLREALEGYERACGKGALSTINCMERLAMVYWKMQQWAEAEMWFEEVIETRESAQGKDHPDTKGSIAKLASMHRDKASKANRIRPPAATLNIPGMTRSKVSPDGKITHTGAKLVVIMVGLPAQGRSWVTDKIRRYLSWQQHDAKAFRVRNGQSIARGTENTEEAEFFRTGNIRASMIREKLVHSTLDYLLEFLLVLGGSVGILDAPNLTLERRQSLYIHVKDREPKLGVVFIETLCIDEKLLEANIASELRGPEYEGNDSASSLVDFKKRLRLYEKEYRKLGDYEEEKNMQYIKVIDVGRKTVHHRLEGFLTGAIASYLSTFNTSSRQIWITRHGQSYDNILGKIGGDSDLTERGARYGSALYKFIDKKRAEWQKNQQVRPHNAWEAADDSYPGEKPPPDHPDAFEDLESKNFCVWTSMLKRSIDTAKGFEEDDDYDVMAWEMLNQLNTGNFDGLTFEEIESKFPEEAAKQRANKLHYTYPGVHGEGYMQVISRLREFIREMERIKDHILVIGHTSICRVLMAYLLDLTRNDIADLDMPLGMLYSVETKDDGTVLHAYQYEEDDLDFMEVPNHLDSQRLEGDGVG